MMKISVSLVVVLSLLSLVANSNHNNNAPKKWKKWHKKAHETTTTTSEVPTTTTTTECVHIDYFAIHSAFEHVNNLPGPEGNDDGWWSGTCNLCQWRGVHCFNGRVIGVELYNYGLSGHVHYDDLPEMLHLLGLTNNGLNGVLDCTHFRDRKFRYIRLGNNPLDAVINCDATHLPANIADFKAEAVCDNYVDYDALTHAFEYASNLPNGWFDNCFYCYWNGVTCDNYYRVTHLDLPNVNGTIKLSELPGNNRNVSIDVSRE